MAELYTGRMIDPQIVRQYARYILNTKAEIEDAIVRIYNRQVELDEGWRDLQNHKFTEEFVPHVANIKKMSELLEQYATYCNQRAEYVEQEYNT